MTRRNPMLLLAICAPLLTACIGAGGPIDFDFRGNAISNANAPETAARPEPDAQGLITYPNYQVVVARSGDTVGTVATRIGIEGEELARFNGRTVNDPMRGGEVLALPRRLDPAAGTTATTTDITQIATSAIDAAEASAPPQTIEVQDGQEPVRHRVTRGETAYSVARLYGVSVRALADWNGLGPDLSVREGQFLIIPLVIEEASTAPDAAAPGASATPEPPSAATALPEPIATAAVPAATSNETTAAPAPTPAPAATQSASSNGQLLRPVSGDILRPFSGSNEGIDIAAATGTNVSAAAAGEVAAITRDTDQIPILVLRHPDNMLTVYANIQNIRVSRGDTITRGQTVADVGPGDPSFLHFEVRRGFEAVDPTNLFE